MELSCLFLISLMKLMNMSVLVNLTATSVKRPFSVLTLFSTKLQNTLVLNSLDELMLLLAMEPHVYGWNSWFEEIPEETAYHKTKLMQLNYSHLKILKLKVYSSSLFWVTFFFWCACSLMIRFCYLKHSCFFSPFLQLCKIPIFYWKGPFCK